MVQRERHPIPSLSRSCSPVVCRLSSAVIILTHMEKSHARSHKRAPPTEIPEGRGCERRIHGSRSVRLMLFIERPASARTTSLGNPRPPPSPSPPLAARRRLPCPASRNQPIDHRAGNGQGRSALCGPGDRSQLCRKLRASLLCPEYHDQLSVLMHASGNNARPRRKPTTRPLWIPSLGLFVFQKPWSSYSLSGNSWSRTPTIQTTCPNPTRQTGAWISQCPPSVYKRPAVCAPSSFRAAPCLIIESLSFCSHSPAVQHAWPVHYAVTR